MRPVRQSRPADTTDAAPGFAWDHRPPTCRNAWAWPNAAAPQLTPLAPVPGSRAWPGFAARRAAPMAHMPCTWARPNAGRGPRAAPLPPPVPGAWPTPSHHHALPVVTPRRESSSLREPPALRISVLRINGRTKKYRSNLGYAATDLKIGGFHQADKYTGFTHWLLTDPRQVGAVKWSRNSSLAIVQSREHGHNGDTLHIQTDSKEDVRALADYMSRWYGDGGTQVVEIGRSVLVFALCELC